MRIIVLAAGHGLQLDGFNKLLIRDPFTGKNVLETFAEIFPGIPMQIAVGYNAINIMNQYPDYDYVFNESWSHTNNSYSLALALDEDPCIVVSSDIFMDSQTAKRLLDGDSDLVLTAKRANRTLSSLNCQLENGCIREIYQGNLRNLSDPEAIGAYKISTPWLLREWKVRCMQFPNLFCGQNLPVGEESVVRSLDLASGRFDEVNTPMDYIRLLRRYREERKA